MILFSLLGLVAFVGLVGVVGPFILLYGYLLVWRPETLKSARSVRFGMIGGPLVSAVSAVGGIVASTRIEPVTTSFGKVRPIAFVDTFALGVVFGTIIGIGSTVLVLRSGQE